jgi:hypothetical protein
MSADIAAVNEALKAGSKPENLVMAPSLLFMDPPTQAALEEANRLSGALLAPHRGGSESRASKKPWWRFCPQP